MKLGIMQPYFFPYFGYWQLLNAVDKYIILDDVTFIKQGYINRNAILSQDKKQNINVMIDGVSSNKLIVDHYLNPNNIWKKKLLKTIQQNYSKAKYFEQVFSVLEDCILFENNNLSNYLTNQIRIISNYLDINTEIVQSSKQNYSIDLKAQDRVLIICKIEYANEYYNAIGGRELYNKDSFVRHNIELKFLKMNDITYPQFNNDFIPYLSIIDVLMFNSVEETKLLLNNYSLE